MVGIIDLAKKDFGSVRKAVVEVCKDKRVREHVLNHGFYASKNDSGDWVCDFPEMEDACYKIDSLRKDWYLDYIRIEGYILLPVDFAYSYCDCSVEHYSHSDTDKLWVVDNLFEVGIDRLMPLLKNKSSVTDLGELNFLKPVQACACYLYNKDGVNILEKIGAYEKGELKGLDFIENICEILIRKFGVVEDAYLFISEGNSVGNLGEYLARVIDRGDGTVTVYVYPKK